MCNSISSKTQSNCCFSATLLIECVKTGIFWIQSMITHTLTELFYQIYPRMRPFNLSTFSPSQVRAFELNSMPTSIVRIEWIGLKNLGSTCYMNASLQLLASTPNFIENLYNQQLIEKDLEILTIKTQLKNHLYHLLNDLAIGMEPSDLDLFELFTLCQASGWHKHTLTCFEQSNEQDFITFLLYTLNFSSNSIYLSSEECFVPKASSGSNLQISLPISLFEKVSISQTLNIATDHPIESYEPNPLLFIHLQRDLKPSLESISDDISFPRELSVHIDSQEVGAPKFTYKFIGAVCHEGTLFEGHYTSVLHHDERFIYLDDNKEPQDLKSANLIKHNGSTLLYQRTHTSYVF